MISIIVIMIILIIVLSFLCFNLANTRKEQDIMAKLTYVAAKQIYYNQKYKVTNPIEMDSNLGVFLTLTGLAISDENYKSVMFLIKEIEKSAQTAHENWVSFENINKALDETEHNN